MSYPSLWAHLRSYAVILTLATASGCEVGRSFFQMSSDSPVPFFGVDLMPRRRTSRVQPLQQLDAAPAPAMASNSERGLVIPALLTSE